MIGGWFTRDVRSLGFPLADGVITVSEGKQHDRMARYDWELEYKYAVGGREYTGRRYAYTEAGWNWYRERDVNRMLAAFPVGTRVAVAYNPDDPADAALRRGQAGQLFERAALLLLV